MLYQLFDSITLQCLLQVCGLRTVHLTSLKNLICVDIVKCQVKFCLLIDFLYRFLTNLASTGGPHKISRRPAGRGLDSTDIGDLLGKQYKCKVLKFPCGLFLELYSRWSST